MTASAMNSARRKIFAILGACAAIALWPAITGHAAEPKGILHPVVKAMVEQNEPAPEAPAAENFEEQEARRAIKRESFYDPTNPDLGHLQRYEQATRGLPFDANGFPDWMRALREGVINPRMSLNGQDKMQVLDLDVIMRHTKEMPNVRFPHRSHTLWLDCSNCHPDPFKPVAGSNSIRMADIFRGKFCGKCHDRVAFITFFSCFRCHSVPQGSTAQSK